MAAITTRITSVASPRFPAAVVSAGVGPTAPLTSTAVAPADAHGSAERKEGAVITALPAETTEPVARAPASHTLAVIHSFARSSKAPYRVTIGASFNLTASSGGTGAYFPDVIFANSLLYAQNEFSSLATLFTEFFVQSFELRYQPRSRYQMNSGSWASEVVGFPLHVVSYQHGVTPVTSHTAAASNSTLAVVNSADPWKYTWMNAEKRSTGVVVTPAGGVGLQASQGWCRTEATVAAKYTGEVQVIAPSSMTTSVQNLILGAVTMRWDVYFRCRV